MEFIALSAPMLTHQVADKLALLLEQLAGVEEFTISVETQQFRIVFDETELPFNILALSIADSGCPIQSISAATFK